MMPSVQTLFLSICLGTTGLVSGCAGKPPDLPKPVALSKWFCDVTVESGLDFIHEPTIKTIHEFFMPGAVGSGAAVFDYDNDGKMDILLLQDGGSESQSMNKLFRQSDRGRFDDVSRGSGLDFAGLCMGVAIGDINNDGLPDVFMTGYGDAWLFMNRPGKGFDEITKQAGLENPYWGTSATFTDFDRDGWLDLVIVNYVEYQAKKACFSPAGKPDFCGPSAFQGAVTRLYHNLGISAETNEWSGLEDVTVRSGLGSAIGPGLGVVCADFNGDKWPDILVSNDGAANHLWINQTNGTFREEALLAGVAFNGAGQSQANMGVAIGDLDGDGLFELFITHLPNELNVCWKQESVGVFSDNTVRMGLAKPRWRGTGFGTVFGDFNQDGALDIAVANGGVRVLTTLTEKPSSDFWGRYAERNQLFANDGQGNFRDISEGDAFCGEEGVARGLVCADLDGDGALDLLVTRVGAAAQLFRNVAPQLGHWLMVRAIDPNLGGRDAYGATVTVEAGGRRFHRLVNPGYSYCSSNDPRAHFGLGQVERYNSIRVVWPDGMEERFQGGSVDCQLVLRKGSGSMID